MGRLVHFRVAGRDVHIVKLVGAFIIFGAALMFVQSSSQMFDSWDIMKYYDSCVLGISSNQTPDYYKSQFGFCAGILREATGIVVRPDHPFLTLRQFSVGLLAPMASLLFWLAVLFLGYLLYRSDRVYLPIGGSFGSSGVAPFSGPVRKFAPKGRK
ncbi:MAG: hypothetical protein HY544_03085 [Candidatus Diapherotrites archaeon]|uniref:Uncharacterized protein n=1 Tax=Candidatus Iainarchaeum sp. TaxID=3101447 RepID=A0A8T3YKZ0_9ARCH|nr:hypothetical protein [Candidatus Diapherotrites archaeon]